MTHFDDVKQFQAKIGFPERSLELSNIERLAQRARLITEEFTELVNELGFDCSIKINEPSSGKTVCAFSTGAVVFKSKTNLLKEMCDLTYTVEGTAVELGFKYDEAKRRVSANNLEKVSGDLVIVDGKIQKPAGHKKPILDDLV